MSKIQPSDPKFEALLDHIKKSRGFDLTGYKRPSLMRRVQKRMMEIGATDYYRYIDYLEVHPREFEYLFNTVLINVTSFFRDSAAWQYLVATIIPRITVGNDKIRIWSAGCATGQEAYSIAMVLSEALGEQALHERVKIYATDVDEDALAVARQAVYDSRQLEDIPADLRQRYFTKAGLSDSFRSDIRRVVIFGKHDLVQDAPIPKLNLLLCRNTLMYLNAETQSRILTRLHFALKPDGYLFLGRAEMLLNHSSLFEPLDLQNRIFSKVSRSNMRDRNSVLLQPTEADLAQLLTNSKLKKASLERGRLGQVVVDDKGQLVLANEKSRQMFKLHVTDIGRHFRDLELSYRPVELRSLIETSINERRSLHLEKIVNSTTGEKGTAQYLQIRLSPLTDGYDRTLGVSITFDDTSQFQYLLEELRSTHEEFETTNEELQSTNEELETTNEELQSTNEELETTNEELQSTNEELETTNAELQSTNEELESTNIDLKELTVEVEQTNSFLQSVLTSLSHGVVVLDKMGRVTVWNKQSEDLWGLRGDEVIGQPFFTLDIGFPTDKLKDGFEEMLLAKKGSTMTVDAINRRGKSFKCKVRATPLVGKRQDGGAILLFKES